MPTTEQAPPNEMRTMLVSKSMMEEQRLVLTRNEGKRNNRDLGRGGRVHDQAHADDAHA